MRTLRWVWPMIVVAALILVPWCRFETRPRRPLRVVVLDKTVPFPNRVEHRSLFWLMRHVGVVKPEGGPYDPDRDYLGAFPGPKPGDPPQRTEDLTPAAATAADLVYLADTYGVYRDDLKSGPAMQAALERSPKIYGGLTTAEAEAAEQAVAAGRTLVAEFNTLASPTPPEARERMERLLGVRWTRWIGRYFADLGDPREVPEWMRRNYRREWDRPWEFRGPGYVLLQDDSHVEVLRAGGEAESPGLVLDRAQPPDALVAGAKDHTSYPYWFDVVEAAPEGKVLSWYRWCLTAEGRERLQARGLPERFPAVVRRLYPGGGRAVYFAGDFADNPMPAGEMPFAGYLTARRWLESVKLAPSELAFYWRFYVPVMLRVLDTCPVHAATGGREVPPTAPAAP